MLKSSDTDVGFSSTLQHWKSCCLSVTSKKPNNCVGIFHSFFFIWLFFARFRSSRSLASRWMKATHWIRVNTNISLRARGGGVTELGFLFRMPRSQPMIKTPVPHPPPQKVNGGIRGFIWKAQSADLIVDVWIPTDDQLHLLLLLRHCVDFSGEIRYGSSHFMSDLQGKHIRLPMFQHTTKNDNLEWLKQKQQ